MARETFVVAYEGEDDSSLLDFAIERAKRNDAKLLLVHILEWSPYKFLTPQELEERHMRRAEELSRAHEAVVDPAVKRAMDAGVEAGSEIKYGSVIDLICEIAKSSGASLIIVGRSGSNSIAARMFGSVPLGLALSAPVPTVIVP